jgi:hypothetical protein
VELKSQIEDRDVIVALCAPRDSGRSKSSRNSQIDLLRTYVPKSELVPLQACSGVYSVINAMGLLNARIHHARDLLNADFCAELPLLCFLPAADGSRQETKVS